MNRRDILVAGAGLPVAAAAKPQADTVEADLRRYDGFGNKRSAGPGDEAAAQWMRSRIEGLGYATTLQPFEVPAFEVQAAVLQIGDARIEVSPQPPVRTTEPQGVRGRLVRWPSTTDVRGAVAVVTLPFRRWSSFQAPEIERPVRTALGAGAVGVVVITTGPTGEVLALNVPLEAQPFAAPVVLLAPKAAKPVMDALERGGEAQLQVTGVAGARAAHNLIGRLERGAGKWLVISTPRSGWFGCAGERGPGVAVWLALADWASRLKPAVDVMLLSTSGHEFENAGGRLFLKSLAPPPEKTALWVHLGANVAGRDWHDLGPLQPLPSADPQRYLVAAAGLLPACRAAFTGQPGLEAPYASDAGAAGELKEILAAGYARSIGVYGAHRFHHAPNDDLRCVDPAHVRQAATGFKTVIQQALAHPL